MTEQEQVEIWRKEFHTVAAARHSLTYNIKTGIYLDNHCEQYWQIFLMAKRAQKPVELPAPFNNMKTAPKDKPIILDVGYPWLVYGHWNEADQSWCYANLNASTMKSGAVDVWFENEQEKNPRGWLPMPEIK